MAGQGSLRRPAPRARFHWRAWCRHCALVLRYVLMPILSVWISTLRSSRVLRSAVLALATIRLQKPGLAPKRLMILVLFCCSVCSASDPESESAPGPIVGEDRSSSDIDQRVQLIWTSERRRRWDVRVSLVGAAGEPLPEGSISDIENHCQSVASTGSLGLSDDRHTLTFESRAKMIGGSVQFRVRAPSDAKLIVSVERPSDDASRPSRDSPIESVVTLKELLPGKTFTPPGPRAPSQQAPSQQAPAQSEPTQQGQAPAQQQADEESNATWSLQRIAGDELRIDFQQASKFYSPESEISFSVRGNSMIALASRSLVLRYELYRVGDDKVVSEKSWPLKIDASGHTDPILVTETAPSSAGVYEVRCSVGDNEDSIWTRLRRRDPPLAHVGKPIVVLPSTDAADTNVPAKPWETVGSIRPSQSATWSVSQWLPANTTRLIAGSGSQHDLTDDQHAGEDVSIIKPAGVFQATVPVKRLGYPHKVTVRYPDGQTMRMRVDIAGVGEMDDPDLSFVLIHDKSDRSDGGWVSHTFVHYPRINDQIRFTNLNKIDSVAFQSIHVQAGPGHLATTATNSERPRIAALQLDGFEWVNALSSDTSNRLAVLSCQRETIALYRLWVATDRLQDYLIASGMNAVCVPAVSGGRAWFPSESFYSLRSDDSLDPTGLDDFLTLIEGSNLRAFFSLDVSAPLTSVERLIRQTLESAEPLTTAERIDASGRASSLHNYNGLHPVVRDAAAELVGELHRLASKHTSYAGIALQLGRSSHLPMSDEVTISDSTLALFASSAAGKTVSRAQLRSWVSGPGKTEFQTWMKTETRRLYQRLATKVDPQPLVLQAGLSDQTDVDSSDLVVVRSNLVSARNVCRVPLGALSRRIRFQQPILAPRVPAVRDARVAVVSLGNSMPSNMPPLSVINDQGVMDANRVIDRYDPSMIWIRSSVSASGLSPDLAQTLSAFTALPAKTIPAVESVDPEAQAVRVRSCEHRGHLMLVIANRAPWASEVLVECSAAVRWKSADGSDPSQRDAYFVRTEGTRTTVTLPAGGLVMMKSTQVVTGGSVKSWTSRVFGGSETLDEIKKDVSAIVVRLGILSDMRIYPVLANAGFEQQGGMGLVGWLHAQYPPDSVRIDGQESIEGKQSVLMTTGARASNRAWLVSETFSAPESGRLAVSLACRGELGTSERGTSDAVQRIRVSIEGTRRGEPFRKSSELEVPRDGKWQAREVVLEVDGIESLAANSLRLTIDSLSEGRVWIDDVRLHDWFPIAKERGELQRQAFLAVQGLQRGNPAPSARLLENHWARFLLTEGAARRPPAVIEAIEKRDKPPGVAERVRGWLPRTFRF